jgi:long-chain acyl-CoA synthetase
MTLGKWLLELEHRNGTAVEYKKNNEWHKLSWSEYLQKILLFAQILESNGMKKKDHVGIVSATRWEWAALDMAILGQRGVTVPMFPNLSDSDLTYIINHSEVSILVIETEAHEKQIARIAKQLTNKPKILNLTDLNLEVEVAPGRQEIFFKACQEIKPKDIATIVYTSGTTGTPKGVVLLHEAIFSEITESFPLFGVKPEYRSLTFLPYAHVLGRIEHWGSCFNGHTLAYAESIEKVKSNLTEVKPDFMIAVPRIFEKVYSGILSQVETQPLKLKLFNQALFIAKEVQVYRKTKQAIPWTTLLQYEALSRLVFAPIKKAFGGNLLFAISGGAPLSPQLAEFFASIGINVIEGYGLTETCAAITVNSLSQNRPGTVGLPIGDVEIKFASDQEILVKSKKCLKEYYKNPEATAEVMQDGFFATGDIGHFNDEGRLIITDRKKDLIKTAGGKYVAPQKLEGLMKQEPLISQILIHGDQKKFVSALISIEEPQLKSWAQSQNITYTDWQDLYQNPALRVRIQKHIQSVNSQLASYESIKKFEIVPDSWTVENGLLTQSLKVKRKVVEQKYTELLNEMYE